MYTCARMKYLLQFSTSLLLLSSSSDAQLPVNSLLTSQALHTHPFSNPVVPLSVNGVSAAHAAAEVLQIDELLHHDLHHPLHHPPPPPPPPVPHLHHEHHEVHHHHEVLPVVHSNYHAPIKVHHEPLHHHGYHEPIKVHHGYHEPHLKPVHHVHHEIAHLEPHHELVPHPVHHEVVHHKPHHNLHHDIAVDHLLVPPHDDHPPLLHPPSLAGHAPLGACTPLCSVLDLVVFHPEFTTLVSLVRAAGLVDLLSQPGPITLFAPTNAAFDAIPPTTFKALLTDRVALQSVLLRHVTRGALHSGDFPPGPTPLVTGAGERVTVTAFPNQVTLTSVLAVSHIVDVDNDASNGVVHVVDSVF